MSGLENPTALESVFVRAMQEMISSCGRQEQKSGFRANFAALINELDRIPELQQIVTKMQKAEKLDLMHSELSEALEGLRGKNESDKIPSFTAEEEELADLFIRTMSYADMFGLRLGEAIVAKARFNATRSFKHGKSF